MNSVFPTFWLKISWKFLSFSSTYNVQTLSEEEWQDQSYHDKIKVWGFLSFSFAFQESQYESKEHVRRIWDARLRKFTGTSQQAHGTSTSQGLLSRHMGLHHNIFEYCNNFVIVVLQRANLVPKLKVKNISWDLSEGYHWIKRKRVCRVELSFFSP